MFRLQHSPRTDWQKRADDYGFKFHTMYGQPYWDESAYYQFTLKQIEEDIEAPTEELHQMCLHAVDTVCKSEYWLEKFKIPHTFWDAVNQDWQANSPSLYSRLDLVYDGQSSAKLLENNADTPTSLYETGFWQWLWLEDNVKNGSLPKHADQFNSLQEKLVNRFAEISGFYQVAYMHFACCKNTDEDRGTVQYLQDCAAEAGLDTYFTFIEDIGLSDDNYFTDHLNQEISTVFKLYPWEFMQREDFAEPLLQASTHWIEPLWKSVVSNKALLPLLWKLFPNHPNLLPAFFEDEVNKADGQKLVKKPFFSREGANISIIEGHQTITAIDGPYGEEGYVYQAFSALPRFADNHTIVGSWLVNDKAAGISIREDTHMITQDLSRYLPHIILG
ncbi:glutathionylspermidine synthase family protein [Aestuariibacter sp. AA17]|uniref:Glutathionylspermidine synthase family protein n=1 Tax=Fluctibacter corallii TaxID=2984329 RepID=A0ABT3ABM1_9ALTE|nr:glutathionylspermidine synthase family protein [Aestuariibacter sp. AA17]MCV2886069.1 glutathionylspermidine synthase family protein [Aestuariibacter sp. AA17]